MDALSPTENPCWPLAGIDLRTTTNLREKEKRQDAQAKRQKYDAEFFQTICFDQTTIELESPDLVNYDNESDYEVDNMPYIKHNSNRNTHLFPQLAVTADRFGLSNVAVAAIANAALQDLGLLSDQNKLDKNKVSRERKRMRKSNILENVTNVIDVQCIGYDGRRDKTKGITSVLVKGEEDTGQVKMM